MEVSSNHFERMLRASRDFCLSIDFMDEYETRIWLIDLNCTLTKMHAAMAYLQNSRTKHGFFSLPDLDDRFELFCRIKNKLGSLDECGWDSISGTLAEHLCDVFFEIRRGLMLIESEGGKREDGLVIWQSGFYLCWGRHLVDAIHQLHQINVNSYFATINRLQH